MGKPRNTTRYFVQYPTRPDIEKPYLLGTAQDMPKKCPRYAQAMPKTCQKHPKNMPKISQKYTKDI